MTGSTDGWTPADVIGVITNPFSAITFAADLFGEHEPMVDEDTWVKVNVGLVEELGVEAYLRNLLVVLKTGKPKV